MLHAYEVNRTRAYSMSEQGVFNQIFIEEVQPHFCNEYYEEFRTPLGRFSAHSYNDITGEVQIIADGEVHEAGEIFSNVPNFSVPEVAAMLHLSEQRIRQLIADDQIKAKKRTNAWFVSGKEILAFSLLERPAHRPKSQV